MGLWLGRVEKGEGGRGAMGTGASVAVELKEFEINRKRHKVIQSHLWNEMYQMQ